MWPNRASQRSKLGWKGNLGEKTSGGGERNWKGKGKGEEVEGEEEEGRWRKKGEGKEGRWREAPVHSSAFRFPAKLSFFLAG